MNVPRTSRTGVAVVLVLAACASPGPAPPLDAGERGRIVAHGPWPAPPRNDPTNRVSGNPNAAALGERLFFSPGLSGPGTHACATCHATWRYFTDGEPRALGIERAERNTMPLRNVAQYTRFGWEGAHATLWAQSLRPLLDAREMGAGAAHVASVVRRDAGLVALYRLAFGMPPPALDEALFTDVGKALAAFQETLSSGRTPFDEFRDAVAAGDASAASRYRADALRGLRVFVGKGGCASCHAGPLFSDSELHRSLIGSAPPLSIRTPSLRDAGATGPYMHDGSIASLCDAVRPHAGPPPDDPPTLADRRDLVAFLRTLGTEPDPPFAVAGTWRCGSGEKRR